MQNPLELSPETHNRSKLVARKSCITSEYGSVVPSSSTTSNSKLLLSSTIRTSADVNSKTTTGGRRALMKRSQKNTTKRRRKEPRLVSPKQAPWSTHPWVKASTTQPTSKPNRKLVRKYSDEDEESDAENSDVSRMRRRTTFSWSDNTDDEAETLESSHVSRVIKTEEITLDNDPTLNSGNCNANGIKSSISPPSTPLIEKSSDPSLRSKVLSEDSKQPAFESISHVAYRTNNQNFLDEWLHSSGSNPPLPQQNVQIKNMDTPSSRDTSLGFVWTNLSDYELRRLNDKALERAMCGPELLNRAYTSQEFLNLVQVAKDHFFDLEALEASAAVTRANRAVGKQDSSYQSRAQYGRTLWTAGEFLLGKIGQLRHGMVFCDIGHGVGNLPIQASFCFGCESRGIEMVGERHEIAANFKEFMLGQHQRLSEKKGKERRVGSIRLRHGNMEDDAHRSFLTDDVDLLYCNNFNGVFGVRANDRDVDWCLDDILAGLFTLLKPGAKLVTLYQLHRLPLPRTEANEARVSNGLAPRDDASYYELEIVEDAGGDGKLSFTWKPFTYFVYTRVGQATFLCHEKQCSQAQTPISASKMFSRTRVGQTLERWLPITLCPYCGREARNSRRRQNLMSSPTK